MRSNKDIRAYAIEKDVLIIQIAKEWEYRKVLFQENLLKNFRRKKKTVFLKQLTISQNAKPQNSKRRCKCFTICSGIHTMPQKEKTPFEVRQYSKRLKP